MLLDLTEKHDKRISELESESKRHEKSKVDVTLYKKNEESLGIRLTQVDYSLGDLNNNMTASDNFMEKYQPI
jgi:hypothetical protein